MLTLILEAIAATGGAIASLAAIALMVRDELHARATRRAARKLASRAAKLSAARLHAIRRANKRRRTRNGRDRQRA